MRAKTVYETVRKVNLAKNDGRELQERDIPQGSQVLFQA